ncbi:hypothetical protein B9T31_05690 [Acinetobacter sp. ANC 4558]|uniref:sulfurtransferase n=1 Tax=Acinetobacter sp. ANC 4558 TaxID=1977876 RepID=UPI000A32FB60|nr:rhodanese-like domain-containing protein [Acinetobacter sp. ANC 4558]OTG87097.1 hypothetical protein B9T31_05690 [Acinetobacter sp. ANC 4558]
MSYLIQAPELVQQLSKVQLFEVGAKTANLDAAQIAYQEFLNAHIPLAQYVDLHQDFCNLNTHLQYQCPTEIEMHVSIQKFNIDWHKPVVIYDRENHIWAARLFWVLTAYGHPDVRLLNGGLHTWKTLGYEIHQGQSQIVTPLSKYIYPKLNTDYFANLNDVKNIIEHDSPVQLLNVLREVVFRGDELRYARAGHIPRSINIPFSFFLDENGQFIEPILDVFAHFELDLNREIIIYCGSGVTASGAALALLQARAKSVKIYDGSMSEWSEHSELPLKIIN